MSWICLSAPLLILSVFVWLLRSKIGVHVSGIFTPNNAFGLRWIVFFRIRITSRSTVPETVPYVAIK